MSILTQSTLVHNKQIKLADDGGSLSLKVTFASQGFRKMPLSVKLNHSHYPKDQMIYLGTPQKHAENIFRLIKATDTKGNILRIITNCFGLSPEKVSNIYKLRWLKQHVNIKHFYGMSENAVLSQIYIALIAYCLHVLIQLKTQSKKSLLRISRWLKAALWKSAYIWLHHFRNRASP